jgi:hypothetical protein
MAKIHIISEHLQLAEPLMQKYYDYDSSMLFDEIQYCVEKKGINCIYPGENGELPTVNRDKAFQENKNLGFTVSTSYKKMICEQFSNYFHMPDNDDKVITDDNIVMFCMEYMSYIYYKTREGLFDQSVLIGDLDLEYEIILRNQIYPEILTLYKMILESKTKRNRDAKVTISYKQDKIDINTCSWFLDDMEKYFADRFPDLTLEKINQFLFSFRGKAGRKFKDRTITNIIWGTYQLLYNCHSKFKQTKVKISNEICEFIIDYLDYLEAKNDYSIIDIRDILKHMIKNNYIPQWDLPWRNIFSDIKEKQPENYFDQPIYRYNIY